MNFLKLLGISEKASLPDLLKMAREKFGLDVDVTPLQLATVPARDELEAIAVAACVPGAVFYRVVAKDPAGRPVRAFVVVGAQ